MILLLFSTCSCTLIDGILTCLKVSYFPIYMMTSPALQKQKQLLMFEWRELGTTQVEELNK